MDKEDNQEILLALIQRDIKDIKKFIENADKKYASKIVEKLVYGIVGLILLAVASSMVAGVIKAAEFIIIKNI